MRIRSALLCFSLTFSAIWAAEPAPSSPTDTYIMARDRYIAEIDAIGQGEARYRRDIHALAALERRLLLAIPPWKAAGFPAKGRIFLETLDRHQLGFGLLDGMSYATKDTTVLLTNVALVKRWTADHQRMQTGPTGIPLSPFAALRSEEFYGWAIEEDADTPFYGVLPVSPPKGADITVARLTVVAQEAQLDSGPSEIVVAVVRDKRVFIAEQSLAAATVPLPVCQKPLAQTLAKAEAMPARPVLPPKVQKGPSAYNLLVGKADNDYRACFAAHLREQPHYKAIVRQAQALVDLLH